MGESNKYLKELFQIGPKILTELESSPSYFGSSLHGK